MILNHSQFSGMIPRLDQRSLPMQNAALAVDCDIVSGKLRAIEDNALIETLDRNDYISIYPYNGRYLKWTVDVDVAESPISDDGYRRIYYTGDGVPKVRGIEDGVEKLFPLGIPAPTSAAVLDTVDKSTTDWTRQWHYHWEEPDGTTLGNGDLAEGDGASDVRQTRPGKVYTLLSIPAKPGGASADAFFVLYFDAYDERGNLLGRCYPEVSAYRANNDLYVAGAKVSSQQYTTTICVLTLAYDTTRTSDYTVDRSYVYTYVSAWGEEGPPSPPTDVIPVDPSQNVLVSYAAAPTGYNITRVRIYRTVTGNAGTQFQFVYEVDGTVGGVFTDTLADSETAEVLTSSAYDPPFEDLIGLVRHPSGFLAGFRSSDPQTVWLSVQFQPHAWPRAYGIAVRKTIVALEVIGNSILVLTEREPEFLSGDQPSAMARQEISILQPCLSKRGVAKGETMIIYPSPDGLVAVDGSGNVTLLTEGLVTKHGVTPWSSFKPESMIGCIYDNRYVGWSDGVNIMVAYTQTTNFFVQLTGSVQGVYAVNDQDTVTLIEGDRLTSFRAGTGRKTALWRGKMIEVTRPMSFVCGRVRGDTYPATFKLYDHTGLATEITADDLYLFNLPELRDYPYWQMEVQTTGQVNDMAVCTSRQEMKMSTGGA